LSATKVNGKCFCGAVKLEITGSPVAMGYCHCKDCAAWSATPINSYSLWKPNQVKIIKGEKNIATFSKTTHSKRKFCKKCGGHILNDHPESDLVDVFAVILENFVFKPTIHVNYESKTVSVKDGLTKFKNLPIEFNGGTGETLPE
tara:strand:- start:642 stop:1076 length:435 start_codon:yes stop_codon:yes gene_type:complete